MKNGAYRLTACPRAKTSWSSACGFLLSLVLIIFFALTSDFTARAAQGSDKTTKTTAAAVSAAGSSSNNNTSATNNSGTTNGASGSGRAKGDGSNNNKSSTLETEINAGAEPPSDDTQKQAKATLTVRLYVPQMTKRTDEFKINPFTTAPPKIAIPVAPLPDKPFALKQKIMNAGYNNRQSFVKPYSDGGWRWHYCYEHAMQKSGITVPHLFFQLYSFADDLMPYVIPEVKRINQIELNRLKNYYALRDAYNDNHKDEEMEALRLGLEPIKLTFSPTKMGKVLETSLFITPGDWWITGSHKTPGLIYFWQEPVKLRDGEQKVVNLTDENAILIQGGW